VHPPCAARPGVRLDHIYRKTGVCTRTGVALFAMEHDLVQPGV
jgi:hypothetical protein